MENRSLTSTSKYLWLLYLIPVFAWGSIEAGLNAVFSVFRSVKAGSSLIKLKTKIKSGSGLLILSTAITLMPGAVVADLEREDGSLTIQFNAQNGLRGEEVMRSKIEKLENILLKVFG
jgi:multisubunit Na+/H+ antiporter MnhE subunit